MTCEGRRENKSARLFNSLDTHIDNRRRKKDCHRRWTQKGRQDDQAGRHSSTISMTLQKPGNLEDGPKPGKG